MSASQIFILSRRGDILFFRDFRKDIRKSNDIFFHNLNILNEEEYIPPIMNIEGINFIHRKTEYLYFVISTLTNFSPNYYLEIIDRLMTVIEDHLGDLSEETIRKNILVIYEIIDEMIDFGYPQLSETEQIKEFVFADPIVDLKYLNIKKLKEIFGGVKSQDSTQRPIKLMDDSINRNEIFVDLIEKITCLFGRKGNLLISGIDGCIKMKSFLKNSPELKIVLSDDIEFGHNLFNGKFVISGYNFCNGVRCKDFEKKKTLYLVPHEGEFVLMNYRINNEFAPPFKLYTIFEESDYKLGMRIKLLSNFNNQFSATNIKISFNSPKDTQSVHFDLLKDKEFQKFEYFGNKNICTWKIPKMCGGSEIVLDIKFTLQDKNPSKSKKELGPITMSFDIPNHNISNIGIKELKIMSNYSKDNPNRWIRSFTKTKSYVVRIA